MKRRKIMAALLAFSLIASMSCGCRRNGYPENTSVPDEETEQTTEETSEETDETEGSQESSETTPQTEETEEVPDLPEESSESTDPDAGSSGQENDVSQQFQMLRDFAQQYSQEHGGSTFGYGEVYRHGDFELSLFINSPDEGLMAFECDGQDVNQLDTSDADESACISPDVFFSLPCPFDTNRVSGCDLQQPSDGTYYGDIVAMRLDGGEAMIWYGDGYTMTQEEVEALNVGDVVTLPYPVYAEIGGPTELTVSSIVSNASGHDCYVLGDNYSFAWTGDSYLLYDNSNPVVFQGHMATVPISEDVTVTEAFMFNVDDEAAQQQFIDTYGNGNALLESDFYYSVYVGPDSIYLYTNDGWSEGAGQLHPFTVSNGSITDMTVSLT